MSLMEVYCATCGRSVSTSCVCPTIESTHPPTPTDADRGLAALRLACIALLANLDSDAQFEEPDPTLVDAVRDALGDTPEAGPGCVHCGWAEAGHPFEDHPFQAIADGGT